jgi:CysZ protein
MTAPSRAPQFDREPSLKDFGRGLALPFRAAALIFRSSKLLAWSALSALVTLVTLVLVVYLSARYCTELVDLVFTRPGSWYGQMLWYAVVVLTFGVMVVIGANALPTVLLAPLQDPLSETTEELVGNYVSPPLSIPRLIKGATVSIGHTLARVFFLVLGHALLFPLHFIPGIGSIVWGVLASVWSMAWLAGEYLDGPMARHLYRFSEVRQVLMQRKALALGFGAAVYVMLWVPVVNFFFIPTAVVAGTLLFRGLVEAGTLRPPPAAAR